MNNPNISPRRRRRIFQEHQLRQEGRTLEQIATQVNVSIATVHADLKLLEEGWTLLTQDIHHDLLLHQVARLDQRVEQLSRLDPVADVRRDLGSEAELSYDQLTQIRDRHERCLARAERELRMLLKQLHIPHIYPSRFVDYAEDELADPQTGAETDRKNLKEPETVSATIPRKTLEIVSNGTPEKSSAANLKLTVALPRNARRNTGRNQPCPCGSGRKRKRCHPDGVPSVPAPERGPASAQAERQSSPG
ncbi:MAG: SEC-C metal-binding domain-containing protein [Chloroflexota bacterium]|nr:SEC-C metal-binding domain-containing protein [Chloroflexota bacterium]